jgi:4a-hydroxytetrahydrobiopterin dehydratase
VVERLVANEKVEGSSPFARSIMMSDLSKKKCIPCEGNIPPFDISEIHKYLKKVDGWEVESNKDQSFFLKKEFTFKNFLKSQNFVNKVSEIAEKENHHPDISFGWGYCKIKIFTHAIKGLAESDFILAAKIDKI